MADSLVLGGGLVWAEVWLPLALNRPLTYLLPAHFDPRPGLRVVVPLKGKKLYTGVIWKIQGEAPTGYEAKNAIEIIDSEPFLSDRRMAFMEWLAQYYCCSLGEVLLAAIPAPFRVSSESFLQLHPDYAWQQEDHDSEEFWLFSTLAKKKKLELAEVAKVYGPGKSWLKKIRRFQAENKVLIFDELTERFRPRTEIYVELATGLQSDEAVENVLERLAAKPDEEAFFLKFLAKTRFGGPAMQSWAISKNELSLNEEEKKVMARLVRRGILIMRKERLQPFANREVSSFARPELSIAQTDALTGIEYGFSKGKTVLLMGVTGSGKTEIYINLIQKSLAEGKQCLLLLPEIAITVQMVTRLHQVFKESLGVYHSRASMPERMEVWEGIATGKLRLVVGVRSAIFLPFNDLGLIVADEEHDTSYKQTEPAPRYHGRDAAIYLAALFGANTLLGSATPSVESYQKARSGKWHLVQLEERFGGAILPDIRYVDMKKAARTLSIKLDFSAEVVDAIASSKESGNQSIVFQNRRGYAPCLQCQDCGWIPYCPSCDVSLTYHQARKSLNCHYCGHHEDVPRQCLACGSVRLQTAGYGTEKLEESLCELLPHIKVARMDQDTVQSRKSYEGLLRRMETKDLDVLVGTQMVTKGLDFDNVTFVAVLDLDRVLHYPEYTANERTFQLLTQIAGRAGRRQEKGLVLVQTQIPYHPIYSMVAKGQTDLFYEQEVLHRQNFDYPPFSRLIRITARHKTQEKARESIELLAGYLRKKLGSSLVLGPETPLIARLRNQFIFNLMLKIPNSVSAAKVKLILRQELMMIQSEKELKSIQWIVDVDPN